jgi:hypothetical protein
VRRAAPRRPRITAADVEDVASDLAEERVERAKAYAHFTPPPPFDTTGWRCPWGCVPKPIWDTDAQQYRRIHHYACRWWQEGEGIQHTPFDDDLSWAEPVITALYESDQRRQQAERGNR